MRRTLTAVASGALLALGLSAPTPAQAASCPISVAQYGYDVNAAKQALAAVTSTCRTIVFPAGTYSFQGRFIIDRPSVRVLGRSGAVIQPKAGAGWSGGGMVHVTANGVTVSGLTLSHSLDKGIEVYDATGFTVSGNTVHHSTSTGIHVLRSSGTVSGNRVYRSRSNGVDLHGALDTVVEGNRVYLNGAPRLPGGLPGGNEGNGILVYASQRVRVLSNTVWNNSQGQPGSRDGIRLADNGAVDGELPTRYVTVSGNTIYDNQASGTQNYAIRIGTPYADRSTINYITVKNNTGWGNLRAGVFVSRMVPGATYVSSGNSLKGR